MSHEERQEEISSNVRNKAHAADIDIRTMSLRWLFVDDDETVPASFRWSFPSVLKESESGRFQSLK